MSNIPNEKQNISSAPPNKRLWQTQAKVDEVVDIMKINVDKVLERDKNLSKLDNRADALQAGASQFEASAGKLKRKFWLKNCKILLALGVMITILVIVFITWIVSYKNEKKLLEKLKTSIHSNDTVAKSILDNMKNDSDPTSTVVSSTLNSESYNLSNSTKIKNEPSKNIETIPAV